MSGGHVMYELITAGDMALISSSWKLSESFSAWCVCVFFQYLLSPLPGSLANQALSEDRLPDHLCRVQFFDSVATVCIDGCLATGFISQKSEIQRNMFIIKSSILEEYC